MNWVAFFRILGFTLKDCYMVTSLSIVCCGIDLVSIFFVETVFGKRDVTTLNGLLFKFFLFYASPTSVTSVKFLW